MQGLSDVLADVGEGMDETSAEEYTMMLEVMMADHPGWPHPPAFSWNVGMVMHILKSDSCLRELEHMQVDGLGTAYLFFYDKQGHWGLGQDTAHAIWAKERLKNSSSKVSLVVRNVSDSHIILKKGVPVARVMSASPVPPMELSPEMEATLGMESHPEPMSVAVTQEKLAGWVGPLVCRKCDSGERASPGLP